MKERTEVRKLFSIIKNKSNLWNDKADSLLQDLVSGSDKVDWNKIRKRFKNKSIRNCKNRYKILTSRITKFGYWDEEEDKKLKSLVKIYGPKWGRISRMMITRNAKQIRNRYVNMLDKTNIQAKFSLEEDLKIYKLHSIYGNKWAEISQHITGRSADNIKNRFKSVVARRTCLLDFLQQNMK